MRCKSWGLPATHTLSKTILIINVMIVHCKKKEKKISIIGSKLNTKLMALMAI